jgi:DNA-binding CsgD family transcriptional regulator/PAS domain-containing protein
VLAHNMEALSQSRVLGLIGRIYDAAADAQPWPTFLERFADAVAGTATALVHYDFQESRANIDASIRFDPDYVRRYDAYYGSCDAWKAAWLARFNRTSAQAIVTCEELVDPDQLGKTEFFNDYLLPQDTVHQFGGPINIREGRWCSTLTCLRPRKTGPFGPEAVSLLRLLLPHLQRVFQLHRRLAELEGRYHASLHALDCLPTGVMLLDDQGWMLTTNREADRLLHQNDGLSAASQGIKAASQCETKELHRIIAGAARTSRGEGISSGGLLALPRPSGKRPLSVLATPVARYAFTPSIRTPAVVVFVTDPERKPESLPGALTRLYQLTAAESRLAELLMQGVTVVRAAEQLRISHNTARTHLQRIYQKTGTKHQSDLVRLLLSGVLVRPTGD